MEHSYKRPTHQELIGAKLISAASGALFYKGARDFELQRMSQLSALAESLPSPTDPNFEEYLDIAVIIHAGLLAARTQYVRYDWNYSMYGAYSYELILELLYGPKISDGCRFWGKNFRTLNF